MPKQKTRASKSPSPSSSSSRRTQKIQNIAVTSDGDSEYEADVQSTPTLPTAKHQAPPPTPRKTASTSQPMYKKSRYSSSYQVQSEAEDDVQSLPSSPSRSPTPKFIRQPKLAKRRVIDSVQMSDYEDVEEDDETVEMASSRSKPRPKQTLDRHPSAIRRRRRDQSPELIVDDFAADAQMESSKTKKKPTFNAKVDRPRANNRRVSVPWTDDEFKALRDGMIVHQTSWVKIKADTRWSSVLKRRSIVDLKDKARAEKRARIKLYGSDPVRMGIFAIASALGGEGAHKYADR